MVKMASETVFFVDTAHKHDDKIDKRSGFTTKTSNLKQVRAFVINLIKTNRFITNLDIDKSLRDNKFPQLQETQILYLFLRFFLIILNSISSLIPTQCPTFCNNGGTLLGCACLCKTISFRNSKRKLLFLECFFDHMIRSTSIYRNIL